MKVIVIGGGASGLMAAGVAAQRGLQVHLFEKNSQPGRKILLTGNGRCNVTNAGNLDFYLQQIQENPKFLYPALSAFSGQDMIEFLHSRGVPVKIEDGGRAFPCSEKAEDVLRALVGFAGESKVKMHMEQSVQSLLVKHNEIAGITLSNGKQVQADRVVVAAGGMTYPATGSTGDGYQMAQQLGHSVIEPCSSLLPIRIAEQWGKALSGLSINAELALQQGAKIRCRSSGDFMFTHNGCITGPVALDISREISIRCNRRKESLKDTTIFVDFLPHIQEIQLENQLIKKLQETPNKSVQNVTAGFLPGKLNTILLESVGLAQKKANSLTKPERKKIIQLMKKQTLSPVGTSDWRYGVVSSGGVSVKEVNPKTMASKLIKNLYFAGEVLDVDAYTGGFNLQIAFSTGFLAGNSV